MGVNVGETGSPDGSMGVDLGDMDLDGRFDLWVANYEQESFALYRNTGSGLSFIHASQTLGISAVGGLYVGWGAACFDVDRDGDEDLMTANGHVVRHPRNAPLRQKPLLFENQAGKRLVNVAEAAGDYTNAAHMGRGLAVGDLDNDGDLDVVVSHMNEPAALLENATAGERHWLSLRLIGVNSNRNAIGATVRLKTVRLKTAGGLQIRQVKSGASYASSNDFRLFFGLGEVAKIGAAKIESIEIAWPSGKRQKIEQVEIDRNLTLVEPM